MKKAKGAAGIDGQNLSDVASNLRGNLKQLLLELREKRYQPMPVKRVEIDKDDGGKRLLGIPAVRDRIVQQALLDILPPIFDPDFHPSSNGCRPKRSCHQAITKAALFIRKYDRRWVVDMDLSKCFDRLNHELILKTFRRRVTDGSVLNLIQMFLESGVMIGHQLEATELGSPQGGVIRSSYTRIQDKKLKKLKEKVKQITRRSSWTNVAGVIRQLNPVIRGFANYFRIANCSRELKRLMGWIRRRLRCIRLKQWKKPAKLHRRLKQLGYKPPFKYIKMRSWRNAASPLAHYAMPNSWFKELKLFNLEAVKTGVLAPYY